VACAYRYSKLGTENDDEGSEDGGGGGDFQTKVGGPTVEEQNLDILEELPMPDSGIAVPGPDPPTKV
jgi:hypothetical protein